MLFKAVIYCEVNILDVYQQALKLHEEAKGKLEIMSKVPLETAEDLSLAYTPGVAEPCRKIAQTTHEVYRYTSKGNTVAVVTDGTAVLGLGDIGPEAALPVMEGKAVLFKQFAGVNAIPICLATTEVDEIVRTVELFAPTFGGINLEDISAPHCFEVERKLKERLNIPVFHDDQHGTAIVVTAAMLNALKIIGKDISSIKVVVSGVGAAGTAISNMLLKTGIKDIILCNKKGILTDKNTLQDPARMELIKKSNPRGIEGTLSDALEGADVFVGVSAPGIVTSHMVSKMAKDSIVFAMANPEPEIFPDEAKKGGARIIGTGRSDFPNQINNLLAFPGVFKGALQAGATEIDDDMKMAAANAIAEIACQDGLKPEAILPSPLDSRVADKVAEAVKDSWLKRAAFL